MRLNYHYHHHYHHRSEYIRASRSLQLQAALINEIITPELRRTFELRRRCSGVNFTLMGAVLTPTVSDAGVGVTLLMSARRECMSLESAVVLRQRNHDANTLGYFPLVRTR